MPYTLLKFLLWFGLAALIGGAIGWLLRSLKCRSELAEARASTVDDDDVERMRHRLANLEQVVAERDRLRMQVADLRAADSPGIVGAADATIIGDDHDGGAAVGDDTAAKERDAADGIEHDGADEGDGAGDDAAVSSDDEDSDTDSNGEPAEETASSIMPESPPEAGEDTSDATVAGIMSSADAADDAGVDEDSDQADTDEADSGEDTDPVGSTIDATELDLGAAASVLGKKIKLDDLTAVEGIGPKISELCRGIDVSTWRQLADTDVADLRSMLDAAGPRYQIHKPESWPRQAELLATGQWDAFKALTDELDGGR